MPDLEANATDETIRPLTVWPTPERRDSPLPKRGFTYRKCAFLIPRKAKEHQIARMDSFSPSHYCLRADGSVSADWFVGHDPAIDGDPLNRLQIHAANGHLMASFVG